MNFGLNNKVGGELPLLYRWKDEQVRATICVWRDFGGGFYFAPIDIRP